MKKFLIITKNHPIGIMDLMYKLYQSIGSIDMGVFIGSPQFTAYQVEQIKGISYMEAFYPALRSYKKINEFAGDDIHTAIIVGTIDVEDLLDYDVVVGYEDPEVKEYTEFPEEFNTTEMKFVDLRYSDIIFTKVEELIHFLRIIMAMEAKDNVNIQ